MSYANCEKHGRQFFIHHCEECKKELDSAVKSESLKRAEVELKNKNLLVELEEEKRRADGLEECVSSITFDTTCPDCAENMRDRDEALAKYGRKP